MQPKSAWALGFASMALAHAAAAAEVRVVIAGLRSDVGSLLVAVCPEADFLQPGCPFVGSAPAMAGEVTVADVPPGTYAVQVVHDENDNQDLDRSGFLPDEGLGFSRDVPLRFGPPDFADAAFDLSEPGTVVELTMRYFR